MWIWLETVWEWLFPSLRRELPGPPGIVESEHPRGPAADLVIRDDPAAAGALRVIRTVPMGCSCPAADEDHALLICVNEATNWTGVLCGYDQAFDRDQLEKKHGPTVRRSEWYGEWR